jgi:ribosomal protein S18 acetylase RimI-like enzyme
VSARLPAMVVHDHGNGRWTVDDGELRVLVRPDQRAVVLLRGTPTARAALLDAAIEGTTTELYASVPEADTAAIADFTARGFTRHRREHNYSVPTGHGVDPTLPPGYELMRATDADPDRWRRLDDTLRQDVPGADGWRNDPARFIADTVADPEFDPDLYLIAVAASGGYAGLVRVWSRPTGPRLGLIATTAGHRRRGLARAMLGRVLGVLHERGLPAVVCEIDERNAASTALFTAAGARRTSSTLELRLPRQTAPY